MSFFLRLNHIPLHVYTAFVSPATHPCCLGCFHLWSIMSHAAVNVGARISLQDPLSLLWGLVPEAGLLDHPIAGRGRLMCRLSSPTRPCGDGLGARSTPHREAESSPPALGLSPAVQIRPCVQLHVCSLCRLSVCVTWCLAHPPLSLSPVGRARGPSDAVPEGCVQANGPVAAAGRDSQVQGSYPASSLCGESSFYPAPHRVLFSLHFDAKMQWAEGSNFCSWCQEQRPHAGQLGQ